MQKEKPVGSYEWRTKITLSEILRTTVHSAFRNFIEVDLAYPEKTHHVDNDFTLATEKIKTPKDWRSDYANSFRLNVSSATEKLVETLLHKTHYICHDENLKFSPKQCLKI